MLGDLKDGTHFRMMLGVETVGVRDPLGRQTQQQDGKQRGVLRCYKGYGPKMGSVLFRLSIIGFRFPPGGYAFGRLFIDRILELTNLYWPHDGFASWLNSTQRNGSHFESLSFYRLSFTRAMRQGGLSVGFPDCPH